jgi:hypothetical protein
MESELENSLVIEFINFLIYLKDNLHHVFYGQEIE